MKLSAIIKQISIVLLATMWAATTSIAIAQQQPPTPLPCGGCKIAIEAAMRELQGKRAPFKPDPEDALEWPDASSCGDGGHDRKAPPYPPDGFYGDDLCDPSRAAALVDALRQRMREEAVFPGIVLHFRNDPDPEGDDAYPEQGDFANRILAFDETATPGNYCEMFSGLFQIITEMRDVELAGIPGVNTEPLVLETKGATLTNGGGMGWSGADCFAGCGAGAGSWESAMRTTAGSGFDVIDYVPGDFDQIGIREALLYSPQGCAGPGEDPFDPETWTWCLWETLGLHHTRAVLRTNAPQVRGSGAVFMNLGLAVGMGGTTNFPPVENDAKFHKYGSFEAPMNWKRAIGFSAPDITIDAQGDPKPPGDWGWQNLDRMVALVRPQFPRKPDVITLQAGSCASCEPGEVKTTLDAENVNVLIGLGTWHRGSAGYILIRGDTITGWGDEILKADGTVGTGAAEMGKVASVFLRPTRDNYSEGFRPLFDIKHGSPVDPDHKQVLFPLGLADIEAVTDSQYVIRIYRGTADYLSYTNDFYQDSNGFYAIRGSAQLIKTITVTLSMSGAVPNITGQLAIDEVGSTSRTITYKQHVAVQNWTTPVPDAANPLGPQVAEGHLPNSTTWITPGGWEMTVSDASGTANRATTESAWDAGLEARATTTTVDNGSGAVASKEKRWYKQFTWGEELIQAVTDPDNAALTTVYSYYDQVSDGSNYTHLKQVTDLYGHWVRYEYDSTGRVVQVITQFLDRDLPETNNHVVEYRYHSLALFTSATGTMPERIVERIEKLEDHEIARSFTVDWVAGSGEQNPTPPSGYPYSYMPKERTEISCAVLGDQSNLTAFLEAAISDPVNSPHLVRHTQYIAESQYQTAEEGRIFSELGADGTYTQHYYEVLSSTQSYGGPDEPGLLTITRHGPVGLTPVRPVYAVLEPIDGMRTVSVRRALGGQVLTETTDMQGTPGLYDSTDDVVLSRAQTTQWDSLLQRPARMDYLDGTYETTTYSCCGADTVTDREGLTTVYEYDALKRVKKVTSASGTQAQLSTEYAYDAAGRTTKTVRRDANGALPITTHECAFDAAGRMLWSKDALGNQTSYNEAIDLNNNRVTRTTTLPDPDGTGGEASPTEIQVSYPDGNILESSGTGAHPMKYAHGTENDATLPAYVRWTKQIIVGDGGAETEWVKTYQNMLDQSYRTAYADAAESRTYYNGRGEMVKQVDPDGITTLYRSGHGFSNGYEPGLPGVAGDWAGQWSIAAVDMDQDGVIDFNGTDRVSRTRSQVIESGQQGATTDLRRTTVSQWTTNNDANTTVDVAVTDEATTGLESWSTSIGLTTHTTTTYDRANRRVTTVTVNPDGSSSIGVIENGRQVSASTKLADNSLHTEATFQYDTHGRAESVTDTRGTTSTADDRVTTYLFDDLDRATAVTTPPPASGQTGQQTSYIFDNLGRTKQATLPDSGVLYYEYFSTGEVKKSYGVRAYPVEYTYDTQGRIKTLKTWKDFNQGTGQGVSGAAVTTWNYSTTRGWPTSKTYEGTSGPSYEYWPSGRLKRRTWTAPRNVTTDYGYNNAGDLATTNYSDSTPDVTLVLDRRGRLSSVTDAVGQRAYTYNNLGQPTIEDFTSGLLDPIRVENAYDSLFRRASNKLYLSSVLKNTVEFEYDPNITRLSRVKKDAANIADYTYVPNDTLIQSVTYKHGTGGSPTTLATGTRVYDAINRLQSITWDSVSGPDESYLYTYNSANQRTRVDLADGAKWDYGYDALGQVNSGKRTFAGGTPVTGQQFEYTFDSIGNRTIAKAGGDANGQNLRQVSYSSNLLNQYSSRAVSGSMDFMGYAPTTSTVTINSQVTYRFGEFYHKMLSWANSASAVFQQVTTVINPGSTTSVYAFIPQTPESFSYDADGNLLTDGRWDYTWNGENQLIEMQTHSGLASIGVPLVKLEFVYDYMGRRCQKKSYLGQQSTGGQTILDGGTASAGEAPEGTGGSTTWLLKTDTRFVWDDWNLIAEFTVNMLGTFTPVHTFAWGLDLSDTEQGAGGIGGLLFETDSPSTVTYHSFFDGNGNLMSLRNTSGVMLAGYEYGPFGESLLTRGTYAGKNPFQFSTKYVDSESGLLYYGFRYYNASTGRWLSRDPIEEVGGIPIAVYVNNDPIASIDALGEFVYSPNMGTFSGSFGPAPANVGSAVSAFRLAFDHDRAAFNSLASDDTLMGCFECTEIRFVQIYLAKAVGHPMTGITGIKLNKWTLDADTPPFYPYGTFRNPQNYFPSVMTDEPGLRSFKNIHEIGMDFETCAVCSRGGARGDVYGCITWGFWFSFAADSLLGQKKVVDWTRIVNRTKWGMFVRTEAQEDLSKGRSRAVSLGYPALGGSSTWQFGGIKEKPPSEIMNTELKKHFK